MGPSETPRHFLNRCTMGELVDFLDFAWVNQLPIVTVAYVGRRPNRKSDREWIVVTFGGPIIGPASRGVLSYVQE